MEINEATIQLVMEFEGLRLSAYRDAVGVWTIGYGHSAHAPTPPRPHAGMTITKQEARDILAADLEHFAERLRPMFDIEPTPNQFGAMLSLAFNIGLGAFSRSTCLRRFNAGDIEGAAEALTWFNKAGGKVLRGLVRRREAERRLMLTEYVETARADEENAPRQSVTQSTTLRAGMGQIFAGVGTAGTALTSLDGTPQIVALCIAGAVVLLAMWIMRERLKKWVNDGVR